MKRYWWMLVLLGLTACAPATLGSKVLSSFKSQSASLPDLGPAPELTNSVWLNTPAPLRLADLRGKVVGLEMWTYDCINCQHVIPSLVYLNKTYKDQGFVLIGNHFPEYPYERSMDRLKQAVTEWGIEYPVAQDNGGVTWNAYKNSYWPAMYLIDKRGHIRYVHFGEGAYDETEQNVQTLLAEAYP